MSPQTENRLRKGLQQLKCRVKTIQDLIDNSRVYAIDGRKYIKETADKSIGTNDKAILTDLEKDLSHLDIWGIDELSSLTEKLASGMDFSVGKIAQPLRSVLCGKLPAPGIYEVMYVLGKNETLNRLNDIL